MHRKTPPAEASGGKQVWINFTQTNDQQPSRIWFRRRYLNPDTKKPAPEYPTAGAYSDRGKRIGPVFSSVEKTQDFLGRR
jgi:hypothetical protein